MPMTRMPIKTGNWNRNIWITYWNGKSRWRIFLDDNAKDGDVDLTAMTLQSLEPYQDEEDVKEVIDKGVEFLADIQDDDGGYTAFGAKSSESISQTVIASVR